MFVVVGNFVIVLVVDCFVNVFFLVVLRKGFGINVGMMVFGSWLLFGGMLFLLVLLRFFVCSFYFG